MRIYSWLAYFTLAGSLVYVACDLHDRMTEASPDQIIELSEIIGWDQNTVYHPSTCPALAGEVVAALADGKISIKEAEHILDKQKAFKAQNNDIYAKNALYESKFRSDNPNLDYKLSTQIIAANKTKYPCDDI